MQLATASGAEADGADAALRRLAVLDLTPRPTLDTTWSGDQARGGVVVAVLGAHAANDTAALRRIRHDAGAALAVVLDVQQWTAARLSDGTGAAAAPLLSIGWRAAGVGPRDRLDTAWRDLGRAPSRGGRRS
ncbi:hypothetical protein [Nocardioides convexus]|uniref:hypothetical protein n=1 Tax=Nocardioides convexus TaxID=2712224 RepID=UPI002418A112|nr:hypothetical protein [Nocardioides convexus]